MNQISKSTFIFSMVIVVLVTYIVTRELTSYRLMNANPQLAGAQINNSQDLAPKAKSLTGKDGNEADPYEKEQVKNTIIKNSKVLQECFTKWLDSKPQKQYANIKMDWTISPSGAVKNSQVVDSDTPEMNSCLTEKVAAIEFPMPPEGRPFYVAHKFSFKTEDLLKKEQKEREQMEKQFSPKKK